MRALLLVDIQKDFLPGGPLGVPRGNEVVPVANRLMRDFELVVATQDWHPVGHRSFASEHPGHRVGDVVNLNGLSQILWPDHCVQGTSGAEFADGLDVAGIDCVVQKGTDPEVDSYSGFFDNARQNTTGLYDILRDNGVEDLDVIGLATDYCVKFSVLDAVELGFRTVLHREGVRGVEINQGDCQRALDQVQAAGVVIR